MLASFAVSASLFLLLRESSLCLLLAAFFLPLWLALGRISRNFAVSKYLFMPFGAISLVCFALAEVSTIEFTVFSFAAGLFMAAKGSRKLCYTASLLGSILPFLALGALIRANGALPVFSSPAVFCMLAVFGGASEGRLCADISLSRSLIGFIAAAVFCCAFVFLRNAIPLSLALGMTLPLFCAIQFCVFPRIIPKKKAYKSAEDAL